VHKLDHDQPKTTKQLLDIATRHTSGEEVIGAVFVQGDGKTITGGGRGAPPKAADKGAKKGSKGNKRGQKRCPQRVAVTTSCDNNDDKEADGSNKGMA
jgi:hypothetical protein